MSARCGVVLLLGGERHMSNEMTSVGFSQRLYREIDVSDWPLSTGEETLGTKPKRWLSDPETAERWLMKDVTFSERNDGTSYLKGDDWSERV